MPNGAGRQNEVDGEAPERLPTGNNSARNRGRDRNDNYYPSDHYNHHHYRGCGHYGYGYGSYGYYYPYRYYPYRYYGPFGYIYYPYSYPHRGYGGYGGYGGYSYDATQMGALDLDVRPEKAEIFIDGTRVGVADQYDGFPSYLWLEKGTYDVVIYKEGYQTIARQISIYPGVVIDVNDRMTRGEARRPEELVSQSTVNRDERLRRDRERAERAAEAERGYGEPPSYGTERAPVGEDPEGVGRLLLQVAPGDVAVYLDGHFLGTAAELGQLSAGLVVEPGDHVLELVRPGYQTERVPITVPPGERVSLDLEMQRR